MFLFWSHVARNSFVCLVLCLLAYAAAGVTGAWAAGCVYVLILLLWHLWGIYRLQYWLGHHEKQPVPDMGGLWSHIFALLRKQQNSQRQRKQNLSLALKRFRHAADVMPDGMLVLDKTGRISWINRQAVTHLTLNLRADGQNLLHNLVRIPEFQLFLKQAAEDVTEIKIYVPKGVNGERALHITRVPFQTDEQLLITHDISNEERLNEMRTAFVANVSHELRTPLTVVNGFLETMADMPDLPQDQAQQFIGLMRKEAERMQTLLADLLTLSRLEAGKQQDLEAVNLSALSAQLVSDGRTLSDGAHSISADIAPDVSIQGVQRDLYNGLSNLVFNAVRYTPKGGAIHIELAWLGQNKVRFVVRDNGPGIAAKHLPHLTERFYRVDKGRSRQSGGTGLGLAITKHALAEHDAVLSIESEIGVGSTFSTVFECQSVGK